MLTRLTSTPMRRSTRLPQLLSCLLLGGVSLSGQSSDVKGGWGDELAPPHAPKRIPYPNGLLVTAPIAHPAPPLQKPPAAVHGIYLNAWVFGSRKLNDLVRLADTTEINAFIIDVKDDTGYLTYGMDIPTVKEIGADKQLRARDTRQRLRTLIAHNIYPIARIVVAKDPLLATRKSAWAVKSTAGGLWRDRKNFAWVDAFNDSVWVYASQIASEAVKAGFAEVQYDYVRFPDEPPHRLATAIFPARRGQETVRDGIARNLRLMRDRTKPLGVPFTIDVFGLTTTVPIDMGIGQLWEDLASTADVVLPMVYPSHYYDTFYKMRHPNSEPYKVVRHALEDAVRRSGPLAQRAEIRPYLQAFTLGPPHYTPAMVRAQIQAVEDVGLKSWVLWNPRSVYDPTIFRKKK